MKDNYKFKVQVYSNLQSTLSQSQNLAITMTDLQWLSFKEILL